MSDTQKIIEDYVVAWNSSDSIERATIMERILADDCQYFDSHMPEPIVGNESHSSFIDRFKGKFPDLKLNLTANVDSHHDYFRFKWQMVKGDGNVFIQGAFFGDIKESQITKLVGFVDSNS